MRRAVILLLVGAAALSGCTGRTGAPAAAPSAASPAPVPSTVDTSGAPAPTGGPTAGPASPRPGSTALLVTFGRQGGLAGMADELVVREDGTFTLLRMRPNGLTRTGKLTAADLANLRQTLGAAGFATLPRVQKGDTADAFTYLVSYGGYQITAQDGAVAAPLRPAIAALSGIVTRYSA